MAMPQPPTGFQLETAPLPSGFEFEQTSKEYPVEYQPLENKAETLTREQPQSSKSQSRQTALTDIRPEERLSPLQRLATGPVGGFTQAALETLAKPVQLATEHLAKPLTPFPELLKPETYQTEGTPEERGRRVMEAVSQPLPEVVSKPVNTAIEAIKKVSPGVGNLIEQSMAAIPPVSGGLGPTGISSIAQRAFERVKGRAPVSRAEITQAIKEEPAFVEALKEERARPAETPQTQPEISPDVMEALRTPGTKEIRIGGKKPETAPQAPGTTIPPERPVGGVQPPETLPAAKAPETYQELPATAEGGKEPLVTPKRGPGIEEPTQIKPLEPEGGIDETALKAKIGIGDKSRLPSQVPSIREDFGTLKDYTDPQSFDEFAGKNTSWWNAKTAKELREGKAVKIYRAVPNDVNEIHPGAYVSQSRAYVEDHLTRQLKGQGKIIEATATADELAPINPNEFFYVPRPDRTSPPSGGGEVSPSSPVLSSQEVINKIESQQAPEHFDKAKITKQVEKGGKTYVKTEVDPNALKVPGEKSVEPGISAPEKGAVVIDDKGKVIDGRHRTVDAKVAGETAIEAYVPKGAAPAIIEKPQSVAKIVQPAKPKIATENQSLSGFIANQGGISLQKSGALTGEFRAIRESGNKGRTVIKAKEGKSADLMSQAAHDAGFIESPDPALLAEALGEDIRGNPTYFIKGDKFDRKLEIQGEKEMAIGREMELKAEAKSKVADLEGARVPLEYKGKIYDKAIPEKEGIRLTDDIDTVIKKPEEILAVEKRLDLAKEAPFDIPGETPDISLTKEAAPKNVAAQPTIGRQERMAQLEASVRGGEQRLKSRVNAIGEKLSEAELKATARATTNARRELSKLQKGESPRVEPTEAGMQGVLPKTPQRAVPETPLRPKAKQAETLTPLEETGATEKQPTLEFAITQAESRQTTEQRAAAQERQRGSLEINNGGLSRLLDRTLTPEQRGQGIIREMRGTQVRKMAQLEEELKTEQNGWDIADFKRDAMARSIRFTDNLERGRPQDNPADTAFAAQLRKALDDARKDIQDLGTGALENYIENFAPHYWKEKVATVKEAFQRIFGKRPLQGPASFLKERTHDYQIDGINAGLTPLTYNPAKMTILKVGEMRRYKFAHDVKNAYIDEGLAKFYPIGSKQIPKDWRPLGVNPTGGDTIFDVKHYSEEAKGLVVRGRYYAPEGVAKDFNNFLSPGFRGNPLFDSWIYVKNNMNAVQLGMSGFHVLSTSLNDVMSSVAKGLEQTSKGEVGKATRSFARAPISPALSAVEAGKIMQEYLKPGSYPEYAETAKGLEMANARIRQPSEYTNQSVKKFMEAWRGGDLGKAALHVPGSALELTVAPIMQFWVPRLKVAVSSKMFSDIFERARNEGWDHAKTANEIQKAYDSVDNRLGQVNYENIFVSRKVKDLVQATFRAPGWRGGTIREIVGGGLDLLRETGRAVTGRGFEVTPRMAYIPALYLTHMVANAVYQFLSTGETPQSVTDLMNARTGKTDKDGRPERIGLPDYTKDIASWKKDFGQYVVNGLAPGIALIKELHDNRDFYGTSIYNPDDPIEKQLEEAGTHMLKSMLPFSVTNLERRQQMRGETMSDVLTDPEAKRKAIESFAGILPAPASAGQSEAEQLASRYMDRRRPQGPKPQEKADREAQLRMVEARIRLKKMQPGELAEDLRSGKVTGPELKRVIIQSMEKPLVRAVKYLTLDESLRVWEKATPEEKTLIQPYILRKRNSIKNYPSENWRGLIQGIVSVAKHNPQAALSEISPIQSVEYQSSEAGQ